MWGIHWFRRDLRVFGNLALQENLKRTGGNTLGIFCFDSKFLSRSDFSANRFGFFLKTLVALREELREQGGDLLVVDSMPDELFPKLITYLNKHQIELPKLVSFCRDYEPYAISRDTTVAQILERSGIEVFTARDHMILEPQEVLKSEKPGDFYQVYTPYSKKWFKIFADKAIQERVHSQRGAVKYLKQLQGGDLKGTFQITWKKLCKNSPLPFVDACQSFEEANQKNVTVKLPEAGFAAALKVLDAFKPRLSDYKINRDFPAILGTSHLSIYFKNGSITTSQAFAYLHLEDTALTEKVAGSATQFAKELVWREFYYSILFHRPDVEKSCFIKKYEGLEWKNSKKIFAVWQTGHTGFPIVDAGMRQLLQTGWMHNRVRMIVASFLTKDLLIDYKWGELHFMKYLLDGDLAPNNGGWQWAASTGCDPQPYFRIFNPWLQSKRFDPTGEYIKHFIPELKSVPAKSLHDEEADRGANGYPKPIVNHSEQRNQALKLYRAARA